MNPVSIVSLDTFGSHLTVKPKILFSPKSLPNIIVFLASKTLTDHRVGERKNAQFV